MTLRIVREPSKHGATIGKLYVDEVFECYTLEDEIREKKIPSKTVIPAGRYRVIVTPSYRFKRPLPLLLDVPGFSGVRIHSGNTAADTEGCPLVGRTRGEAFVGESRAAFNALFPRIERAEGSIWIEIENPQ